MDLLALDNAQSKLAGGSTSRRITGTVYATSLDASTSIASLAFTQSSQAVLDASTALGGDLSGTHGAATVAKIQGRSVYNAAPNDGDVLTWDNANTRWAPVAPAGGTSYYTILDSTATHTQINTALSTYDVVYLEPGTYSSVTGQLVIPDRKQLIGLSGGGAGSALKPSITLVTSGSVNIEMGSGTLIENVALSWGSGSSGTMVVTGVGRVNAQVRWCDFYGYGSGTDQSAINGSFKEVAHCYIYHAYGITIGGTGATGGVTSVSNVYWIGTSANYTQNSGVNTSTSYISVTDCIFEGGYAGVYITNSYYASVHNIQCINQVVSGGYGVYFSGSTGLPYLSSFSNIYIRGNNTANIVGFYATGDWNTYSNIYAYDMGSYGVRINGSDGCSIDNVYAYDCGDASSASGIYLDTVTSSSIGTLGAYGSGADGVRASGCVDVDIANIDVKSNAGSGLNVFNSNNNCTFTSVTANGNTANGVYVYTGNYDCTFASITALSNDIGVNVSAGQAGLHFCSGTTSLNSTWGFLGGNSGSPACRIDSWYSHSNTGSNNWSLGTGWLNYSSPMKSGDTASGDLSGTYPSPTVDGLQGRTVASTAPSNGQMLAWNNSLSQWEPQTPSGGATALPQLSDVYASLAPSDEHIFYYDGGNTRWDSKYPGVVNFPGTRTFTILDNTATSSDINTALTNYDVVYLKTGTYTCGSTAISIPVDKSLLGLVSFGWASTRPILSFSGSPATAHISAGGRLEHVTVALTGVAHTTDVILSTGGNAVVTDVMVSADTAAPIWGFNGEFTELCKISAIKVDGIRFIGSDRGMLRDFWINLAPTYGLLLASGQCHISHGTIDCASTTTYGVYCSTATPIKDIYVNDVVVKNPATTGFHFTGSSAVNTVSAIFKGCTVYGATGVTDRGFYANYATRSSWTNCYAEYCNGTAAQAYGAFCVENSDNIKVSNCFGAYSTNTSNCDFWFNTVNYSTFTGLESRGSYTGAYWYNNTCVGNTIAGVIIRDHTNNAGFPFFYNGQGSSISSVTAYNCVGRIVFDGARLSVSAVTAYNGTNIGVSLNAGTSSYTGIYAYSCGSYGVTANGAYSAYSGLCGNDNTNVGIYIDTGATSSSFTGLTACSNSSYGVQLGNGLTRVRVTGVEAWNNTNYGFVAGSLTYSALSDILSQNNTGGGGFYIGTNDYVYITAISCFSNTGIGISYASSPTTANSSVITVCVSKLNGTPYSTSANWNGLAGGMW